MGTPAQPLPSPRAHPPIRAHADRGHERALRTNPDAPLLHRVAVMTPFVDERDQTRWVAVGGCGGLALPCLARLCMSAAAGAQLAMVAVPPAQAARMP